MAEQISISPSLSKAARYQQLLPQMEALMDREVNLTANLANIAAALKYGMGFYWVGFYIVENNELILGPFQGPVACTRIGFGKGVCGTAWEQQATILVEDVDQFPGHIACSSASRSEIVVPVLKNDDVRMVLDVDSEHLAAFDATDQQYLEQVARFIDAL
jgi:L-methionine (R)-S-oxide reductase